MNKLNQTVKSGQQHGQTTLCGCASNPTSVTEVNSNEFEVYPNPSSGIATIRNKGLSVERVEICNLLGIKIFSETGRAMDKWIDLTGMSKGIYFVRIFNGATWITQPIAIQ